MRRPTNVNATTRPQRESWWSRVIGRSEEDHVKGDPAPPAAKRGDPNPASSGSQPVSGAAESNADAGASASPISAWQARREVRRRSRERKRFERREVHHFTERSRRAARRSAISLGLVVALIGLVAAIVTSPVLRVREIVVEGTSRVSVADVQTALQPEVGGLIAFVDYGRVADRLSEFSLIKSISIESQLPSTLVVSVTERTPLGAAKSGKGYVVFDAAGVTIQKVDKAPKDLPVFKVSRVSVDDVGFRSAVAVLDALPDSIRSQVKAISGTTRDNVTVTLDSGLAIVWGDASQSEFKATVLKAVVKSAPKARKIDISAPDVPVVG